MKTLRTFYLLIAMLLGWYGASAQCAQFYTMQPTNYNDTVRVYPYVSNLADSATATITIDFGDGTTQSVNGIVTHIYDSTGVYTICINYTSSLCTSTYCDSVEVRNCSYMNNLTVSQSTTSHTTTLSVPDAPVGSTYYWYLANGASSSTLSSPSYSYPSGNIFNDYVKVTAPDGCMGYAFFSINTNNTCNATWHSNQYGNDVSFAANQYMQATTYTWSFGDGGTATGINPSHTYAGYGTYNVCLKVQTADCVDSVCQTVTTSTATCPSADSLFTFSPMSNGGVYFTPSVDSMYLYYAHSMNIQYGNGDSSSLFYPHSYQYPNSGTYTACVTYSNAYCNVSQCDTVVIDVCNISTAIYANVSGYAAYIQMTDASPAWTYQWSFAGASPATSTSMATYVTYLAPGTYGVSATITPNGCSASTYTYNVTIEDSCSAYFTSYPGYYNSIWLSASDSFMITQPGHSYHFNYGDGTTGTSWYHTYATAGSYNVCLYVSTTTCSDSFCRSITLALPNSIISGNVTKGGNNVCAGKVYLVQEDSVGYLSAVYTYSIADTGSGCHGNYVFYVPVGQYYIKAALDSADAEYASYMPTYYGDELNWADASVIDLDTAGAANKDIHLIAGTNPGGPGFIGGLVSQGAGLGVIHDYENRAVGDPLPNIQINLLTENDIPVAYTYSDASGMYSFSNIALGTYKVYAEAIAKTPIIETVALNTNNPSATNVDVEVNTTNAVTSINDIAELKVDAVYPNPVKDIATISFTAKQSAEAKVMVSDVRGVVIYTSTTDISAGGNELKINLANYAAGVYTISITNSYNKKLVKLLKAE